MKQLVLLLILSIASHVTATDRFYADIKETSKNGRYQVAATSPQNEGNDGWKHAFQDNFTVTLTDLNDKKDLWSYRQKENEASPSQLIVTDDGYVIMKDAWQHFHVFNSKGTPTKVFAIFEQLPEKEVKRYCDWTTAGTFWAQYSQQDVFTDSGKSYYFIRTYWGRFIVCDIHAAKLVDDEDLNKKIEASIVKKTKALIDAFDGNYTEKCSSCSDDHLREDLKDAAFIIKSHNIKEGKDLLEEVIKRSDDGRAMEVSNYLKRL